MKIDKLERLVCLAEVQQDRLLKVANLLDDAGSLIHASTRAQCMTQVVDLSSAVTYVLVGELSDVTTYPADQGVPMNYTFCADDLDAEADSDDGEV